MSQHTAPTFLRGRVVTPTEVIADGLVVLRDGLIAWVGPVADAAAAGWSPVPDVDATPVTLLPGLVDLHDHGGGGASFPDSATAQEALVAVREHRAHGTTTLVASLVMSSGRPTKSWRCTGSVSSTALPRSLLSTGTSRQPRKFRPSSSTVWAMISSQSVRLAASCGMKNWPMA